MHLGVFRDHFVPLQDAPASNRLGSCVECFEKTMRGQVFAVKAAFLSPPFVDQGAVQFELVGES